MDIIQAVQILEEFYNKKDLNSQISILENKIQNTTRTNINSLFKEGKIDASLLEAALTLKGIVGQINIVIHAWGILVSLPYILRPDETIEYVSLGAGNTGKDFDLKTTQRVAEFKFIEWKGGPEAVRQNSLLKDFYRLVEWEDDREKFLYVTGIERSIKALNSKRKLKSAIPNKSLWEEFTEKHGDRYKTIHEYYSDHLDFVKIVDLQSIVPELSKVD